MKNVLFTISLIFAMSLLIAGIIFAEEENSTKADTYRVVGIGDSLKEAEIDAYQNAIIEFFKKNLTREDIKTNSNKLLKEFFSLNKIKTYIKSSKVVSNEGSSKVKLVVDISLDTQKITETLNKLGINLKNSDAKEEKDEN